MASVCGAQQWRIVPIASAWMWPLEQDVKVAPTERIVRQPRVGSRAKAPGGGPGGRAPGSSQILASLSALTSSSHYPEADELFLNRRV